MKYFILLTLITLPSFAATWSAGPFKINLTETKDGDLLSSDCMKECVIEIKARKSIKEQELKSNELQGGVNPGSVICKRIGADVIYLKNETTSQAFCSLNGSVVSLSRLIKLL